MQNNSDMSDKLISRRCLVKHGLNLLGITVSVSFMSNANPLIKENMNENTLPIKRELIKEFVGNAHGNLDKVRELITLEPNLLNASYDWGGGDFETALNAASLMG